MNKYEVIINGQNFLMEVDGKIERMGFYVTRYVEADNHEEAELKAVYLVRNIERLKGAHLNTEDDPPMLYLEEMYEIENFDGLETLEPGIAFYNDEQESNNAT
ncbi:hypothetical protein ACQE3E_12130 [Methylomonas sp. MED-D]|uniref:hypothetical protein n=1 Tax=unclassified Methylomonas TaxID=2608980 RepID=UPI00143C93EB|nr:hypothetical protein [Methylomonas sp. MV1]MDT4331833.1 hypothetical protein [Methylomonas sp. MV1]NJA07459.1 hypothetical protein [Methylococcaceae bacterium WWC4]